MLTSILLCETKALERSARYSFMAIKVLFIVLFSLICKSYYCSPSAFVERVFHCGWNTSEEKCMSSLVPASSGFHLSIAHCKMIMSK